jgi:hypothetical protein
MKKGNSLTFPFFKKYQTANAANICSFFICGKVKQIFLSYKKKNPLHFSPKSLIINDLAFCHFTPNIKV